MKIALLLDPHPEQAQFGAQIGIQHAIIGGPDSPKGFLEYDTLRQAQELFAKHGIVVSAVENVPALSANCWKDENLLFAQQFGVNHP